MEGASKAANLVGDIAVASNEQAIGVNQVNEGINLIANVVQTTSATSEETASACEELSSQAEMLKNQVGKFKLKNQNETFDYKGMDELNPQVLRILQDMSIEYKDICIQSGKEKTKDDVHTILLSDSEFEKF